MGPHAVTFLDTSTTEQAIRDLLAEGGSARAAVAYWGAGATKRLRIKAGQDLTVVCDLMGGSCNPDEVRKLQSLIGPEKVRTHDRLHAKVWIGKAAAILGSSNASANGLCFEEKEASALVEANVRVQDSKVVAALDAWWNANVWRDARPITEENLQLASERFKQRRKRRPIWAKGNLLSSLQHDPSAFADRGICVWVQNWAKASQEAVGMVEEIRTVRSDPGIDLWENIEDPPAPGSTVIDFNVGRGLPKLTGLWHILDDQPEYEDDYDGPRLLLCRRVVSYEALPLGNEKAWRQAAKRASATGETEWSVDDFARRFLG